MWSPTDRDSFARTPTVATATVASSEPDADRSQAADRSPAESSVLFFPRFLVANSNGDRETWQGSRRPVLRPRCPSYCQILPSELSTRPCRADPVRFGSGPVLACLGVAFRGRAGLAYGLARLPR